MSGMCALTSHLHVLPPGFFRVSLRRERTPPVTQSCPACSSSWPVSLESQHRTKSYLRCEWPSSSSTICELLHNELLRRGPHGRVLLKIYTCLSKFELETRSVANTGVVRSTFLTACQNMKSKLHMSILEFFPASASGKNHCWEINFYTKEVILGGVFERSAYWL